MARKSSVRKGNRSRDSVRNSASNKSVRTYDNRKSYMEDKRDYQRNLRSRQRSTRRVSHDDYYENPRPRRSEFQEYPRQRMQPNRPVREHRNNMGTNYRSGQHSVAKSPGMLVFSFLSNFVFYGVTIGIIAMAVMFSFSSKSTASIFGYRFYTVLTNSMVPQDDGLKGGFYAGDVVIVKLMDGNKIKKDDIVTFAVGDGTRYLTHRMVEHKDELNGEKGDYLITKGDANKTNDPPISADRVLGKVVFAVPKVGDVFDFVREEFWACIVCVLSVYGFFLVLKSYLFSPKEELIRKRRNTRYPMYER
ncbi:signal peptidase I [Candidatus Enterococcus ikei]|uniref:Signal peptidase I n=1 Tax=Candidatus Enterococcus ikei TaxID=2815326 RepID=A0ABS3GXD0_9ENTE|nr:signal peptidase I [Enterococcus sp. DIV0869a]MBO0439917.1 signal peptidase I [Enterococcus sp. DIV0869a]